MILVTGAAGFIGGQLVKNLNQRGYGRLLLTDYLRHPNQWQNLLGCRFLDFYSPDALWQVLPGLRDELEAVIHLGARTHTRETDAALMMQRNFRYSSDLAQFALDHDIRFIYASSAATYGGGEAGYDDDPTLLDELRPLNPYAFSKHAFDLKAYRLGWLERMVGLKFFNVYGPGEAHKGDMVSVIFKAYHEILGTGEMRLFESHRDEVAHGCQRRDFIHVGDVTDVLCYLLENCGVNGLYNLGTGEARTFLALGKALFAAMDKPEKIRFVPMPMDLRRTYQYFTIGDISRLRKAGYTAPLKNLDEGVHDYVRALMDAPTPPATA